jgi:hypothetical protein
MKSRRLIDLPKAEDGAFSELILAHGNWQVECVDEVSNGSTAIERSRRFRLRFDLNSTRIAGASRREALKAARR